MNPIRSILGRRLAEIVYAARWKLGARAPAPTALQRSIFERIHATNAWGEPETRSGPGSTIARGETLRPAMVELIFCWSVKTLLDGELQ